MKAIYYKDRLKYIKACIEFLNNLESNGIYDKMKVMYDFKISLKPMKFIK